MTIVAIIGAAPDRAWPGTGSGASASPLRWSPSTRPASTNSPAL
ncbi:hypothetical protein [Streptomyces sp. NPDC056663]